MANYYIQEAFNYQYIFERAEFDLFSFYIIVFKFTNQQMGVILSWIQIANASS